MPQYEIEADGSAPRRVRARSLAEAAREVAPEPEVGPPEPGSGWCAVTVGGEPRGRVRPVDRMRFRRD